MNTSGYKSAGDFYYMSSGFKVSRDLSDLDLASSVANLMDVFVAWTIV